MTFILRIFILVFLILTPEIRTSSLQAGAVDEEEEHAKISNLKSVQYFEPSRKSTCNLQDLGREALITIGEYLQFPHRDLGGLSREMRRIFDVITPTHVISSQIGIQEFLVLPKCPDLKYLIGGILNDKNLQAEDTFLSVIVDVALLKNFPNIKGPLIRFLYSKLKDHPSISREKSLQTIHPFKSKFSPISALLRAAFDVKDFEMVFDIWDNFPETRPTDLDRYLFTDDLVLAAIETVKVADLLEKYTDKLSMQEFFNLMCNVLALTIDPQVIEIFMKVAFGPDELFSPNYNETFLNAWLYALTRSSDRGHHKGRMDDTLNELVRVVDARIVEGNNSHLGVRKQALLLVIFIRTGKDIDLSPMFDHLITFPTIQHQTHQELILWALIVEERYRDFFNLLTRLRFHVIKSSWLRMVISKTSSSEFITELISNHNTKRLFSNNFYGEAYYNKQLFFHLTGFRYEHYYLSSSSLNEQLFDYLIVHFAGRADQWESFFRVRTLWTAVNFAKLISHLLKHLRYHPNVFNTIKQLLVDRVLRIVQWGRPEIFLTFEEVEFVLSDEGIVDLVEYLNKYIKFRSDPSVSLLSSRLFLLISFNVNDLLLRMTFYDENSSRIIDLEGSLKTAMMHLKTLNVHLPDQEQLDSSIIHHFNPILSKLSDVDYLYVLPNSLLRQVISSEPERLMKALRSSTLTEESKLRAILGSIRAHTIKVKVPQNIPFIKMVLLRTYQINLEII